MGTNQTPTKKSKPTSSSEEEHKTRNATTTTATATATAKSETVIIPSSSSESQINEDEPKSSNNSNQHSNTTTTTTPKKPPQTHHETLEIREDDDEEEEEEVKKEKDVDLLYCFPMNRVSRIIRSQMPSDSRVSVEAIFLINKASEKFLETFSGDAFASSLQDRKGYVGYKHLSSVVSKHPRFDFLSDFVPEKVKAEDALAETQSAAGS